MTVFPRWAEYLGLGEVEIRGIDLKLHDDPARYREVVEFIKRDPLSRGALVTTHKLDLYAAAKDLFDFIDPHARLMAETSCLSKRDGSLVCHAKDPISSGLALDGFLQKDHFTTTGSEVFSMGAGGSTIAITWHLMQRTRGANRPKRIIVSNRTQDRLDHIRSIHESLGSGIPVEYVLARTPEDNDKVMESLSPGALVINATGLGKDAPGSPLTSASIFPSRSVAWELNYRGELVFLDQATRQKAIRLLQVEDGWTYFIHGWTQVIAEVFDVKIPVIGPRFDAMSQIAADITGRA